MQQSWLPFYLNLATMALRFAMPDGGDGAHELLRDRMLDGLAFYQGVPRTKRTERGTVVCESGSSRLLQYSAGKKQPLLFIPSIINKPYILDVHDDLSCVQYFAARGHSVFVIDWGAPTPAERDFAIDHYILRRLPLFVRAVQQKTRKKQVALFGYCLGGTMLAGALARLPDIAAATSSAIFACAPWDFHAGEGAMDWRLTGYHELCSNEVAQNGYLSAPMIQTGFALMDPALWARKYIDLYANRTDPDAVARFIAVEDWLNDPVDLSGPAALQLLHQFYRDNAPFRGMWELGCEPVDVSTVETPSLVISAADDRIVPRASSDALHAALPNSVHHLAGTGHVGVMASRRAAPATWARIAAFIDAPHNV